MPDRFAVRRHGTDSSGRPIYMTDYHHEWWESVVTRLGFRPTIVQGGFMTRVGGGAEKSKGFHDEAGSGDLRTWDLTPRQRILVVRELRRSGAAAWIRDMAHGGMDPHIHYVLGTDRPLAPGAKQQWVDYQAGLDGLASKGRDYHQRPDPLVLVPPLPTKPTKPVRPTSPNHPNAAAVLKAARLGRAAARQAGRPGRAEKFDQIVKLALELGGDGS